MTTNEHGAPERVWARFWTKHAGVPPILTSNRKTYEKWIAIDQDDPEVAEYYTILEYVPAAELDAVKAERDAARDALNVPEVWSQEERDGLAEAFKIADGKHGHYETLFAVAAWILRHRQRKGRLQSKRSEHQ